MEFVFRCEERQLPYVDRIGFFPHTKKRAIKESIKKWEVIVAFLGLTEDTIECPDEDTCPLCAKYKWTNECDDECPVKEKTGKNWCNGSPFRKFEKVKTNAGQLKYAKEEVAFLKSLK